MHVRYPRAAVAVDGTTQTAENKGASARCIGSGVKPSKPLWASPALPVRAGRLIGVRLRGKFVEVALVKQGAEGLRWVAAAMVLSEFQAAMWVRTSRLSA